MSVPSSAGLSDDAGACILTGTAEQVAAAKKLLELRLERIEALHNFKTATAREAPQQVRITRNKKHCCNTFDQRQRVGVPKPRSSTQEEI